jgi:hypothetical protein
VFAGWSGGSFAIFGKESLAIKKTFPPRLIDCFFPLFFQQFSVFSLCRLGGPVEASKRMDTTPVCQLSFLRQADIFFTPLQERDPRQMRWAPPIHSPDAESDGLGSMLAQPQTVCSLAFESLVPEDFFNPAHQTFSAPSRRWKFLQDRKVTRFVLTWRLLSSGPMSQNGGAESQSVDQASGCDWLDCVREPCSSLACSHPVVVFSYRLSIPRL